MKIEDVIIGMKVVPHSKSFGHKVFEDCLTYNIIKESTQDYLYVVAIRDNYFVLGFDKYSKSGDYYLHYDFESYVKIIRNKKIKKINKNDNCK